MSSVPALPAPSALADPNAFFSSDAGERWLGLLADEFPHSRYWRDRSDCWSLKSLNALAARIIDARYEGHDVEEAMEAEFRPVDFWATWHHEVAPEIRSLLRETGIADDGETFDAIRDGWEDHAAARDESSVSDLFASYDYCELLFRFTNERWLDDSLVFSHRPWPDAAELCMTPNLQFALANLGYTVSEFRKASANRRPSGQPLPRSRRRRAPILTYEQLAEIIDNACSTSFLFCLYAVVPIPQLIALDLTRPVTFEKCWVATLDPLNGTYFDVAANGPVTVSPGDGRFLSGGDLRWSPENICCLHTPHYHARLRN
ncbi:hypothetical protein AQZ52_17900 [Novosphingobium fuchskuhlense]|uniref:Uncharacterized protein n=1 Tax=Novosphingobium fuchskuhlense TaxID=1117702 RepID=A0A124JT69_9SPHN|nr:hypothetical protein [Novosphingobium fuchskuhlense]KUR69874.1 hypothetical protein AQZ52_17900 [Novosphingobium fuchskuhlense]